MSTLLAADEFSFWIEVAKQVPALAVLAVLVIYFFKHLRTVSEATEARILAAKTNDERVVVAALDRAEVAANNVAKVVNTNSEVLGGFKALFAVMQEELANAKRNR